MADPRNSARTPPAAPFVHRVSVAQLDREPGSENSVRVSPDAEAKARIAGFLELDALDKMTLSGRVLPLGSDGWEFRGQLTATVVQSCVVSLEPVRTVIDAPVRRRYLPGYELPDEPERELAEEDLEPPEPLEHGIDLGQLAVETLALSVDPWPRAKGVEFEGRTYTEAGGARPLEEPERPFAELATLRARLSRNQD